MGQSNKKEQPNVVVQVKTEINAPADKVWEILGKQFANISDWASFVQTSQAVTADNVPTNYTPSLNAPIPARQTTAINKGRTSTLIEVVTMYSDEKRELKFYGVGLPKFIAFAGDKQSVIATGENTSVVVFDVEVRLTGVFKLLKGKIRKRFSENFKKVQNDLKVYSETGKIAAINETK